MIRTGIDRVTHEATNRLSHSALCLKNDIEVQDSMNSSPSLQKTEIVCSEILVFQCCSGKCYVLIVRAKRNIQMHSVVKMQRFLTLMWYCRNHELYRDNNVAAKFTCMFRQLTRKQEKTKMCFVRGVQKVFKWVQGA